MYRVTLSDDSVVRIHCTGWHVGIDGFMRRRFRWTIRDANGVKLGSGHDLHGGHRERVTEREMAATFAGFVCAWVEALTYGGGDSENRDLFPDGMCEWAESNSDELSALVNQYQA